MVLSSVLDDPWMSNQPQRWTLGAHLSFNCSVVTLRQPAHHAGAATHVLGMQVTWDDVGGLEDLKQQLQEIAADVKIDPETEAKDRLRQPRGLLLYGAPGCSKTLLARVFAAEGGLNFLSVRCTDIFSKYVGESEKAITKTFSRARQAAPAVVFFDEIDGLMRARGDAGNGVAASGAPAYARDAARLLHVTKVTVRGRVYHFRMPEATESWPLLCQMYTELQ